MIVIVILIPPLYFMIRGRWGAFFLNAIPYGIACLFVLTFIGAPFAPLFWFPSVFHALWQWRHEMVDQMMTRQAELIATKMGAQFQGPPRLAADAFCPNCGRPLDPASGSCFCVSPAVHPRLNGPIDQSQYGQTNQ